VPLADRGQAAADIYRQNKARGGAVRGGSGEPDADDVMINASRGEYVLPAALVRKLGGAAALDRLVLQATGRMPR
jgi:hypothetical protein